MLLKLVSIDILSSLINGASFFAVKLSWPGAVILSLFGQFFLFLSFNWTLAIAHYLNEAELTNGFADENKEIHYVINVTISMAIFLVCQLAFAFGGSDCLSFAAQPTNCNQVSYLETAYLTFQVRLPYNIRQ